MAKTRKGSGRKRVSKQTRRGKRGGFTSNTNVVNRISGQITNNLGVCTRGEKKAMIDIRHPESFTKKQKEAQDNQQIDKIIQVLQEKLQKNKETKFPVIKTLKKAFGQAKAGKEETIKFLQNLKRNRKVNFDECALEKIKLRLLETKAEIVSS
jgi:hypothetical protein